MRETTKRQLEIFSNSDSTTLKKQVNKFFCKHYTAESIKTEYSVDNGNYIAFVEYGERTLIPETAMEEYQLKGIEYRCGSCPFYGANAGADYPFSCTKKQREKLISTTKCCNLFYEELKNERISV